MSSHKIKRLKVHLQVEPDDGVEPLIRAIRGAKKTVEIAIFRFDHKEIESELIGAIGRGVAVKALIAFTNRRGEQLLRRLESRLLAAGAVVSRTSDELKRYHGKYMIVDQKKLYLLSYNFARSDIERSRSFGVVTTNPAFVAEARKLFEADCTRQKYSAGLDGLLVSPINARQRLAEFLKGAKTELLIYDPEISDQASLQVLKERAASGVTIRVIGGLKSRSAEIEVRHSFPIRLHARVIVRDRSAVFVGSQSLRRIELDLRREVGIVFRNQEVAEKIGRVFAHDWKTARQDAVPTEKVAKKLAKAVVKRLTPVTPVLRELVEKNGGKVQVDAESLEQSVKEAVKIAVRDAIHEGAARSPEAEK